MAHMSEDEYAKLQNQINAKKVAKNGMSAESTLSESEVAAELLELIATQRRQIHRLGLEVERLWYYVSAVIGLFAVAEFVHVVLCKS